MGGGVPGIDPPDFGPGQSITDALNDIGCRFAVQPTRDEACTLDNFGNFAFVAPDTTIQFCNQIASTFAFPNDCTTLTAQLRDVAGNIGPQAQIVVCNGEPDQ